jgi:hypothetical protein
VEPELGARLNPVYVPDCPKVVVPTLPWNVADPPTTVIPLDGANTAGTSVLIAPFASLDVIGVITSADALDAKNAAENAVAASTNLPLRVDITVSHNVFVQRCLGSKM